MLQDAQVVQENAQGHAPEDAEHHPVVQDVLVVRVVPDHAPVVVGVRAPEDAQGLAQDVARAAPGHVREVASRGALEHARKVA